MKFTADPRTADWLEYFIPESANFDWDEGNKGKNVKHGYSDVEIESVLRQSKYIFAGQIIDPPHAEWRGLILGLTENGKPTALIFTRRGDKIRPISCRPMRKNEWRLYEETIEKN